MSEREFAEKVLEQAKENDMDFMMFVGNMIIWNAPYQNSRAAEMRKIFIEDSGILEG